ncbi:EhaG family protein [Methanomicrobium mobile]|uniref:EhaG family protein n=1 Tax=Methanomicrobium mobile TaxID=2205 RepID=UPI000B0FCB0C|nr:EhaG family protein [Methanomicrobium mobile]
MIAAISAFAATATAITTSATGTAGTLTSLTVGEIELFGLSNFTIGLVGAIICIFISFYALMREKDDLHRLLLTDLIEVIALIAIALLGTDLAEALILPGLVVGVAELTAMSQIYIVKEKLVREPESYLDIEVMHTAPAIIAVGMLIYGIILSGFTGGAVAGLGMLFYFACKGTEEKTEILEKVSGYAWVMWVVAFIVFMTLPAYWFFALMLAGTGILAKVAIKISILGTMRKNDGSGGRRSMGGNGNV